MAATGIGLAAGLGGAALIGVLLTAWGVNKASEARSSANQNALNNLATLTLAERTSRESWQNNHAPTLTQYVDVRAGAGAGANALSVAEALALQNNGINSAIGRDCYLRVQRYSAPQPCGCDTCNG
jgi:Na+(H+)/acetate symporter ActP